jgi:iron complex outermembrane receptor protein
VFDLEQIEVLRGPQGTLFGRNSPAGVVKFESAKPRQTREGYLNAAPGRSRRRVLEGAFNVPLNSQWALRVAGQVQHRGDWVDNTFNGPSKSLEGYDDAAARAQLLYAPGKSFSALFNVHGRSLDGTARLFRANIIKPGNEPARRRLRRAEDLHRRHERAEPTTPPAAACGCAGTGAAWRSPRSPPTKR